MPATHITRTPSATLPHPRTTHHTLAVMDPRAPHIQPVAMTPASGVVPAATNLVDPRPPLKVEKEKVHDFEVHREGGYAKGHTRPSKEVSAMPTDAVAIGAQPHGVVPGAPAVADARILPGTAGTIPGGVRTTTLL